MKKITTRHFIFILSFFALSFQTSCDSYQKVVRSDNLDYKYKKAIEYYNKGSYYKAIPVLEDLLVQYKGTEKAEELYFYYANSHYQQGSYMIASYHFKNYVSQYPYSDKAPECMYLNALSHYRLSPERSLDQSNTYKAIEAFQIFINTYPESDRVDDANTKIDVLRQKLEDKAVENADLYYKTSNYRAASNEYINILNQYPDIDNAEEINFKAVKARYKFAENSTIRRKVERYEETIEVFKDFKYKYPESKYMKEAEKIYENSKFLIIQSAFNHALLSPLNEREKMFRVMIRMHERYAPNITDPEQKETAQQLLEESYFLIVKSNYQLAQQSVISTRTKWYNKTINSYYNFIDKYSSSKFADEAEKLFEATSQNLNKIKNG